MLRSSRITTLAALALVVVLSGCSYFRHRGYDATDVIDLKYGASANSIGLGAKVEATNFIGGGAGFGLFEMMWEDFGRHTASGPMEFAHLGFFGIDGPGISDPAHPDTAMYALAFNAVQPRRPLWPDRFRVGFELLMVAADFGFYLNVGQLFDLLTGVFGWDMAGDDGLPLDTAW